MAIKSEQEVERDFYTMVQKSSLASTIKGKVYRPDMRSDNAQTEDLIVKFLTGIDTQVQSGIVIFNLYVPDILNKTTGRKVMDHARIAVLQKEILSFVNENPDTEYLMETDGSPVTMKNEEIDQHLIFVRIKFNRSTF